MGIVFGQIVEALNKISSQVYAFFLVIVGIFLVAKNHEIGKELVVGGFAILHTTEFRNKNSEKDA